MSISWHDIAFVPDPEIAAEAQAAWAWLLPGPWTPLLCSTVGGIFLEAEDGRVLWLEIGTALVEEAAADASAFDAMLSAGGDAVELWFLPGLVEDLHRAGKRPGPGECYAFTILPVFEEGRYAADNMFVVPAREQLVGIAEVHR
jgi:hypothetical protein